MKNLKDAFKRAIGMKEVSKDPLWTWVMYNNL